MTTMTSTNLLVQPGSGTQSPDSLAFEPDNKAWGTMIGKYQDSVLAIKTVSRFGAGQGTAWVVEKEDLGNGLFRHWCITNAHVVDDELNQEMYYSVFVNNQEFYEPVPAHVQGVDHVNDVAVVWFDSRIILEPMPVDETAKVFKGDEILVIGNQQGEGVIPSLGNVNNVDVYGWSAVEAFQDDTSALPGNSGSPAINAQGRVVGLHNSGRRGVNGMGYNILISPVMESYRSMRKNGFVVHGRVGEYSGDWVTQDKLELLGVQGYANGLVLGYLPQWHAFYRAGVRSGDVLLGYGNRPLPTNEDIDPVTSFFVHQPKQCASVTIAREGKIKTVKVRIGSYEEKQRKILETQYGYAFAEVDRFFMQDEFNVDVEPGGLALIDQGDGLATGVLTSLNNTPVGTVTEAQEAIDSATGPYILLSFVFYIQGRVQQSLIQLNNANYVAPSNSSPENNSK
ncbi:MAG TPA: S1C family serine protease [bacterium]|nr:S1C family serine protease [bacterium]